MKKQLPVFLLVFIIACNSQQKDAVTTGEVVVDSVPGWCPNLSINTEGKPVVSWIREADSAHKIFCYKAIGNSNNATIITIPGSTNVHPHGENLPKVVFKPSGEIIALWGTANPNPKNKYSGLVFYSQSFDKGKTWSAPKGITTDTLSYDQRYFDVALLPNGEAAVVWLDNRKKSTREGSGLYYAVTNGSNGFEHEKLISEPCCQCCRTDLFVDKANNLHVLYRGIINDSIRDMVHVVSKDKGLTFSAAKRISEDNWVISGCPHTGPAMTENKEGFHFAWYTGGNAAGIYYNSLNGVLFSDRDTVSGRMAKHCQITTLDNDNLVIVWNEGTSENSNRIGFELRDENGKFLKKEFISDSSSNSTFPVIKPLPGNNIIVAYTREQNNYKQVVYKQMKVEGASSL